MSATIDRWAQLPGPVKILAAARDAFEHRRTGPRVTLKVNLNSDARTQVAQLLGLNWDTSGQPVRLGKLQTALAKGGDDLIALLERTGGPLVDRVAARADADAAARALLDAAYQQLADAGIPANVVALARERRWLDRAATPVPGRADNLVRLWKALPGGDRPLPELANQLFTDPHALDRDTELGRVAARLLAAIADPHDAAAAAGSALTADLWRSVWAQHGVLCDEVSSTVLVLNLRLTGPSAAAAIANAAADCGEPVWLTVRSLHGTWAPAEQQVTIRVCENPAIVEAAANRYGRNGLPLICIYGRPSAAAWMLLRGLAAADTRLLVTADRDNAGRQFLTELLTLTTAAEWLPDADGVYEEARLDALLDDLKP
ncbi:TIGR02679 domain-containing protein [Couchioplanes caeruleus]|uniref:TIGR02679 domain-containing protein n=1 Tax=Couchioplanes caeruleus TaxID=56438 RepID=UPI0020BE10A7|nr:TIGR02679 domain-containing protein [Couchioplanes caeruleus]UQU62530.1 TIGR02679 domain-containing protein [Couchioplanes caeruleus]